MKICIVTGSRAEYGQLYWLMKDIQSDSELTLQIIATGMHLSTEFGLTYQVIEKEFRIDRKVEMLLSSDTPVGISKSMGIGFISFAEAYDQLSPDLIIVLGDRFEIFCAVGAAMIHRIPVAHLHGGELTEGLIDEPIRHSITKMSHLHFTATEEYRRRVIQLGENPDNVFNVGGIGIDNIQRLKLLGKSDLEAELGFKLGKRNLLVTFHPVTLEANTAEFQVGELLSALDDLPDTKVIFTRTNSDTGSRIINTLCEAFALRHPDRARVYTSLGQLKYLSLLQHIDGVVGNSSSGLIEAPSFKIGTVNIGDRQKGRIKAQSVIDCQPEKNAILDAIEQLYSPEFQAVVCSVRNPYGEGDATPKILDTIKKINLTHIIKKKFFDVAWESIPS